MNDFGRTGSQCREILLQAKYDNSDVSATPIITNFHLYYDGKALCVYFITTCISLLSYNYMLSFVISVLVR